jgi:hypothetical protein
MAKFVGGNKQTPTIVLNEPADLAKWVHGVLKAIGGAWQIRAEERVGCLLLSDGKSRKVNEFILSYTRADWSGFYGFMCESTLVLLAKRFQSKGWQELLAEIEKRAKPDPLQIQPIPPEHSLDSRKPAIGHVPRALPAPKQLKLTHKPAASPRSKQLSLLPPQPDLPCCSWPGCKVALKSKAWACLSHWNLLPGRLQELISVTYRPGQRCASNECCASNEYLEAEHEVYEWIADYRATHEQK